MSDWFNTGWEAVDETYDEIGRRQAENESKGGGGGGNKRKGPFRVRLKQGETRRYMVLDRHPSSLHEHRFKSTRPDGSTEWNNYEPCKKKQDLGVGTRECAVCIRYEKNYPYYVGLFTAMSLTPYFSEAGYEWCFNRYILAARLGSPKRPGMLKRLQRLSDRNGGSLRGAIIECHRKGEKSEVIGDEIDIVEVIPEHEILDWARPQIAEFVRRVNANIRDEENYLTVDTVLNRDPWEPFNFRELIKVRSNDELYSIMGQPRSQSQNGDTQRQGQQSSGYGGGYGQSQQGGGGGHNEAPPPRDEDYGGEARNQQDFLDDDIPF